MAMHLTDLDDDCIRCIFDQLALARQLPLRAVCHRWRDLIGGMWRTRRHLKLFYSRHDLLNYTRDLQKYNLTEEPDFRLTRTGNDLDNVLVAANSDDHGSHQEGQNPQEPQEVTVGADIATPRLVALFPNVSSLTYCLYNWRTLMELLQADQWRQQLHSLTILDMLPDLGHMKAQTFETIGNLCNLKRLHLFCLFMCALPPE